MAHHRKKTHTKKAITYVGIATGTGAIALGLSAVPAQAFPGQDGIVKCESGGNTSVVNNTPAGQRAGRPAGLFQIVTGTWLANGGGAFAPTADRATAAQQQIVADRIYARSGYAPWECKPGGGNGLHTKQAPMTKPHPPRPAPKTEAPRAPIAVPHSDAASGTYRVQAGDTLWGISRAHGGSGANWNAIYALNKQVIGSNPGLILPGQSLRLP